MLIIAVLVVPGLALAQPVPPLPAAVPLPPQGSPLPGIAPREILPTAPGLQRAVRSQAAPAQGASYRIDSVTTSGITGLAADRVAAIIGTLVGPATPTSAIEQARRELVGLYRDDGFIYTSVSAVIEGEALRFAAVEGYIADVKIDGDVGPVATQVLRFLENLVGDRPLSAASLERWLLLAQEIPGLSVRSTLNPSSGDPGALTLIAQVSRRPFTGYLSADNRAFQLTGPEEGLAVANLNSFTEYGERLQASIYRSFNSTSLFGQGSAEIYLGGSGLKFLVYGGAGESTPSAPLRVFGYDGQTRVGGTSLTYPALRSRAQSLNVSAGLDVIESEALTNTGANATPERRSFDSLRIVRLSSQYVLRDLWFGPDASATNEVNLRLSQGLRLFGASRRGSVELARYQSRPDFFKVSGEISRTQTLLEWDDGSSVSAQVFLGWQVSGDLLPAAEKYYLGGPHLNRGFYYGQVTGDTAADGSVELRYTTPLPSLPGLPYDLKAQIYAFFDLGRAWQKTKLESDRSLQSAGGGTRIYVGEQTEIDLEGVYRMTRYPTGRGPGISPLRSAAFYWQALHQF